MMYFKTSHVFGSACVNSYLWKLLRYPYLTVWLVIDLESHGFDPATTMSTWDYALPSKPVEVDLRVKICTKQKGGPSDNANMQTMDMSKMEHL